MKSLFLAVSLFLASLFGSHTPVTTPPALSTAAVANSQPSAPAALAVTSTALPSSTDAGAVPFASNSNSNVNQPTTLAANYATQAELTDQINDLRALISAIATSTTTALTDPQIAADGNGVYYGEVSAPVTHLSNITVSNVSGLTASDIPTLNYFPASSTIAIEYGGTGTSTRPIANKLLLSDASGNWEYVSTSSLGISGGGGGTLTSIGPAGQTQTGPTVTLATSTNAVDGLTSALTITAAGNTITYSPSLSGTLTVAGGGTGWGNIAAGAILYGNGTSALATTTAGTAGYVLAYLNGVPTWTATTTLANITGLLAVSSGGTGSTTLSGLLKGNGTGALLSAIAGIDYQAPITTSYPIQLSSNNLSLAFGTTTPNVWSNLQTLTSGFLSDASSTIGNGTDATGLTINGGATTTGDAYFGSNVSVGSSTLQVSSLNTSQNIFEIGTSTGAVFLDTTSSGNVGIGTTTPGSIFSVNGVANWTGATTTYYSTGGINLTSGCFSINGTCFTGGGGSGTVGSGVQGQFPFYNAAGTTLSATSSLIISQSGNIGVGTTSPGSLLSLNNIANFTIATSTFFSSGGLNLTGGGCFAVNGTCIGGSGGGGGAGTVSSGSTGQLAYYASTGTTLSGSNLLNILGSNFGVGTTTPYADLAIQNNFGSTNGTLFSVASSTASNGSIASTLFSVSNTGAIADNGNNFTVDSSGDGNFTGSLNATGFATFGSTSALTSIVVSGTMTPNFTGEYVVAGVYGGQYYYQNPSSNGGYIWWSTSHNFWFVSPSLGIQSNDFYNSSLIGSGWAVDTGSSGSVTTATAAGSAAAINSVNGNITTSGSLVVQGTATSSFAGLVGIGTVNPQAKLHIYGSPGNVSATSNTGLVILDNTNGVQLEIGDNNPSPFGYWLQTKSSNNNGSTFPILLNPVGGNVGIGTSNPYSRLQVTGPDSASSTSAFAVVSSASTTVFSVFDGGNAQLSGTLTQSSDQRLKTNIQSLDASDTLDLIDQLNPVTFNWIDSNQGNGTQVGFIAQQVQQLFPELVSTTSATALTPNGTLGLNYIGLISPIVSAIQALYVDVQSLEQTVSGFAQSITSTVGNFGQVNTNELCVSDGPNDPSPICLTKAQLASLLVAENQSPTAQQSSADLASATPATTPPSITINGDNPAVLQVGDAYADLGVTVSDTGTGQAGDSNLGVKTFLNGTLTSNIVINTSQVATDTIDYVATDSAGLTSTSTRIVIIEAASFNNNVPVSAATGATSTQSQ